MPGNRTGTETSDFLNGKRFVWFLIAVAVVSAVAIRLGVPSFSPAGETKPDADSVGAGANGLAAGERSAHEMSVAVSGELSALVDTARVTSVDTVAAWSYRRTLVADLDSDGVPERLVLTSDVYVAEDGEPMWEDGHRWAVYVEEDDGGRTLVYGAFVHLGTVEAAVSTGVSDRTRRIVILERGPTRARLLVAAYDGPGLHRLVEATGADIQTWAGADR